MNYEAEPIMKEQAEMGLSNIGKREIREAIAILQKYKNGKANLENRIVEENLWWRRRHWKQLARQKDKNVPAGAQLFTSIENKIADIYDNMPDCAFLPRSADDEEAAEILTSVMPAVLEQNGMSNAYCNVARDKVTAGTGFYAVLWNQHKLNGIGDIDICAVSALNLYWAPGVSDIQQSPNLFFVSNQPNDVLTEAYPQLKGKLGGKDVIVTEYIYEDSVDSSEQTPVIDWYYKRTVGTRTVLHYVKFCGDEVLFASENLPEYAERGWYDHGLYPFVSDVMFPLHGTPCGFGYITVGKEQQLQIDKLSNAIVRNSIIASTRRRMVREGANINLNELRDIDNEIITYSGSGNPEDTFAELNETPLNGNYIAVLEGLENALKETTANRDFAQGGVSGGVTSGTAISALVEAGNKQSRALIRGSYEAYKQVVTLCLELVRQFYDNSRVYRINGDDGKTRYQPFDNSMLRGVPQAVGGVEIGTKEPVFDIKIRAHKQSPFARVTQNEMMKEFFSMGFFAPQNATVALCCLEGMEFEGKEMLKKRIEENGTLYTENIQLKQTALELAAIVDADRGTNITQRMAQTFGIDASPVMPVSGAQKKVEEAPNVMQATADPRNQKSAEQVAQSTEAGGFE